MLTFLCSTAFYFQFAFYVLCDVRACVDLTRSFILSFYVFPFLRLYSFLFFYLCCFIVYTSDIFPFPYLERLNTSLLTLCKSVAKRTYYTYKPNRIIWCINEDIYYQNPFVLPQLSVRFIRARFISCYFTRFIVLFCFTLTQCIFSCNIRTRRDILGDTFTLKSEVQGWQCCSPAPRHASFHWPGGAAIHYILSVTVSSSSLLPVIIVMITIKRQVR